MLNMSFLVAENANCAHITGGLNQNDVALVKEQVGNKLQCVLTAGGNHDVFYGAVNALQRHDLLDLTPEL